MSQYQSDPSRLELTEADARSLFKGGSSLRGPNCTTCLARTSPLEASLDIELCQPYHQGQVEGAIVIGPLHNEYITRNSVLRGINPLHKTSSEHSPAALTSCISLHAEPVPVSCTETTFFLVVLSRPPNLSRPSFDE